jgi:hypothetical protein
VTGFRVLVGVVVHLLINVQLVVGIAMLTQSVLEVLHVATTIAEEIFHHLEVIGIPALIVVKVGNWLFTFLDGF